jgi:hypothetical protein
MQGYRLTGGAAQKRFRSLIPGRKRFFQSYLPAPAGRENESAEGDAVSFRGRRG